MKKNESEKFGRMGEPVSVRFKPHTDFLISAKGEELGKNRSDTVRFIADSYFDKEIQDPELIYTLLNETKRKLMELEKRQDLLMVTMMETARKIITSLPVRQAVSDDVARIEYEKFIEKVMSEVKKNDRGKIESMVLDIYQKEGN